MDSSEYYQRRFNAHLDLCKQCRTHPFNLCDTGAALLRKTADAYGVTLPKQEESNNVGKED